MRKELCPRCEEPLSAPGVWASEWTCVAHGPVLPRQPAHPPTQRWLDDVAERSRVPVWLPWPLPTGWLFTGIAEVGTGRDGPRATVVACSGPNPAPRDDAPAERPADLLLVAESPGVGVGAWLAGLPEVDPGPTIASGRPHATVHADGHLTSMWNVPGPADRAVYAGEAGGVWLYLVMWPATAGVLLVEELQLADVRAAAGPVRPPCGAPCPRLP